MGLCVNINGRLLEPETATVSIFDRGFLYGDSIYEVIRTYDNKPFAFEQHLKRLARSAKHLLINIPNQDWIADQVKITLQAASNPESYIRIIITRGAGPLTLDPTQAENPLCVIIVKELEAFPEWMYEKGIRLLVPNQRRIPRNKDDPAAKTGNYLNSVLALGQAKRAGFDDALILDVHGRVAEATSANIFIVRQGKLFTPTLETGLLTGVTRQLILELAQRESLTCTKCDLHLDDLYTADEIMMTSTLREVMPVVQVENQIIGTGHPGPIYKRIHERFSTYVRNMVMQGNQNATVNRAPANEN